VDEIISPSHALHVSDVSGSSIGPEAYKRQVTRFLTGFPDLHFTIEDTISENQKMVVVWSISGTHKGEFLGVPATNKRMSVDGITVAHIANGKIMDSYISWDMLGMLQQLGAVPAFAHRQAASAP
jgi:steroid delta-isomerase-like uncharacterized protein